MATFDASQGDRGFEVLALILGHLHFGVLVAGEGCGLKLPGVVEGRLDLYPLRPRQYLAADVLVELDVAASPVQAFYEIWANRQSFLLAPRRRASSRATDRFERVIEERYARDCKRATGLFIAESFDGVKAGSLPGRVDAEQEADGAGHQKGNQDPGKRKGGMEE